MRHVYANVVKIHGLTNSWVWGVLCAVCGLRPERAVRIKAKLLPGFANFAKIMG